MAIGKYDEGIGSFFVGIGDVILFNKITDLVAGELAEPMSLGDIHLDSTNYTGEDATLEPLKNERGETYYSTSTAGSIGFEMFVPSTAKGIMAALLDAGAILETTVDGFATASSALGFGASHVSERALAIVNETLDQMLLLPNAKIVASVGVVDKVVGINLNVMAQKADTAKYKTAMLIPGVAEY